MKFLLNLGFNNGAPKAKGRIQAEKPLAGELMVVDWPQPEANRTSRFRRLAKFFLHDKSAVLELYDPSITKVTPNYLEISGIENTETGFVMQSWILREDAMPDGPRFDGSAAHLGSGKR